MQRDEVEALARGCCGVRVYGSLAVQPETVSALASYWLTHNPPTPNAAEPPNPVPQLGCLAVVAALMVGGLGVAAYCLL